MRFPIPLASLVALLLFSGFGLAQDTLRLGGRSIDTHRLDRKASDQSREVTEETCWIRGGYGVGYSYSYSSPSYAFSYYSSVPYYSYYAPAYSYYPAPVYSYYTPLYYSSPRIYYPPVVTYGAVYPMSLTRERQAPQQAEKTFRYDGDPKKPSETIPPARLEEPVPQPIAPAAPADSKLGPAPTELKVSLPREATAKTKREYPAYGENRSPKRDDRTILIRGRK